MYICKTNVAAAHSQQQAQQWWQLSLATCAALNRWIFSAVLPSDNHVPHIKQPRKHPPHLKKALTRSMRAATPCCSAAASEL
jgi:hypothetical protein